MAYYGLLRVPETQDAVSLCEYACSFIMRNTLSFGILLTLYLFSLLLSVLEKDEQAYLNFNSLMYFYPQRFSQASPREALQYTILMYLYGDLDSEFGRQQIEISHDYVRQLVYENQAFSELIGSTVLGTVSGLARMVRDNSDFVGKC